MGRYFGIDLGSYSGLVLGPVLASILHPDLHPGGGRLGREGVLKMASQRVKNGVTS